MGVAMYGPAPAAAVNQYGNFGNNPTGAIDVYPRIGPVSSVTAALTTGILRLVYVTAPITLTITKLEDTTGGTAAAATPTVSRKGLYTIAANGDGTLVACTANAFATLWLATQTTYTTALAATDPLGGAFPTSYQMVAGQRYALAQVIVTAGAGPVFHGMTTLGGLTARAPRVSGTKSAQTDMPMSFTDASLSSNASIPFMSAVP